MSRSSATLAARIAFMDRLSDDLAQRDWLTPDEGRQLVRAQGLVAPAEAIERACQPPQVSSPHLPIHGLDWGRPQDQVELNRRHDMLMASLGHLKKRRSRYAWLTFFGFAFGGVGMLLSLVWSHPMHWKNVCFGSGAVAFFLAMLLGERHNECKGKTEHHQHLLRKLVPVTPTRHQVYLWSILPRLRAYMAACCASDVGLLQGDVEALEAALAKGSQEDQEPLSMKDVQALAAIDAQAWSERQKKVGSPQKISKPEISFEGFDHAP